MQGIKGEVLRGLVLCGCMSLSLLLVGQAWAGVLERPGDAVGEIVSIRGDEQVLFVSTERWQPLQLGQRLVAGDAVKTGAYGFIAIRFEDDTLVRVHRSSHFEVEAVRGQGNATVSRFKLLRGSLWSRAKSVLRAVSAAVETDHAVEMNTPLASIGIRGTDWYVDVAESGDTTVTTLSGEVDLFNALGSVALIRGEQGLAVAGAAPIKRVLVDIRDRPLMALEFDPRWIEMLVMSDITSSGQIIRRQQELEAIPEAQRSSREWLDLARTWLDRGRTAQAMVAIDRARALPDASEVATAERLKLLEAVGHARRNDFASARTLLLSALGSLTGRDEVVAELALVGIEIGESRFADAAARMDQLAARFPDSPDVAWFRPVLPFFAGDQDRALSLVEEGEKRVPDDARFPALAAVFHLARGDRGALKEAFERALALDPGQPLALGMKGLYHHEIEPDVVAAERAFLDALAFRETPETWNNLALVYQDLGRSSEAEVALKKSMELDPRYIVGMVNYAVQLVYEDRLIEAKAVLADVAAIRPGHSTAYAVSGLIALAEGRQEDALAEMNRAVTANPAELQVYTGLAFVHYPAERFEETERALAEASRVDPDDPLPKLISAITAQDQAQAGSAIRYSREALEQILSVGSFEVEDLTNSRSGLSNLGSAYSNLGLGDWGEYYAQRAFSPYNASDHFFLGGRYESGRAALSELGQGLMLDPTAISAPNRYYEPIRAPRNDLDVGSLIGDEDGARIHTLYATAQGFARLPVPIAYTIGVSRADNDGFRVNSSQRDETLIAALGTRLNGHADQILFSFASSRSRSGAPGDAANPDPDDRSRSGFELWTLGWQHRFDYDNRLLMRFTNAALRSRTTNAVPFGMGLDDLGYSLLANLGEEQTRQLAQQGLFDVTDLFGDPDNPVLLSNSSQNQAVCANIPELCGSPIALAIPDRVDFNSIGQVKSETDQMDFQIRHLLSLGMNLDLTYGAEWTPQDHDTSTLFSDPLLRGAGLLIFDVANVPADPEAFASFVYVTPEFAILEEDVRKEGGQAYTQLRWKLGKRLWTEGGVFFRSNDDGADHRESVDPRIGLAWEPRHGHWLRAAFQREMGVPLSFNGSLAPVATVGLAVSDLLPLIGGETVRDAQLRWDAEWQPWLYSFVRMEHQDIDAFSRSFPFTAFSNTGFSVDGGRAQRLTAGVNLWFLDRFGLLLRYAQVWSESTAGDVNDGKDLPLLPDGSADIALAWVHPLQIRLSASLSYVGTRWGDVANTLELDEYLTAAASVNWQPMRRHWSLTLAGSNLLDEDIDLAPGIPSPGRSVSFSTEYRF